MKPLAPFFKVFTDQVPAPKKRGRKPIGERAMTKQERRKKEKTKQKAQRHEDIAVLDMETDPFDDIAQTEIKPFCACLYSDQFEPVVIWEENEDAFLTKVVEAIAALPRKFTVYAHNGGRFDFLFLVRRLRGKISFKGRGIMCAEIAGHQLRDSFHIIPEKLAAFQKEAFDYSKMRRDKRHGFKAEIISYLLSDCRYLFDIVKTFVATFGLKISIGQAAMYELKKHYSPKKLSENWDGYLRGFFFGGRVECLRGRGEFVGDYKLYDVNSLYPYVMAKFQHPIGDMFDSQMRYGKPGPHTFFIDLECNNRGALVGRNEDKETTANIRRGRFFTTIWEFDAALRHNLIDDIKINYCVDCAEKTDFSKFVLPLYEKRLVTKGELDRMKKAGQEASAAFIDMKKDDIFYKLLLNNAYGKFAQDPRRFKEHYLTDPDEMPPDDWFEPIRRMPPERQGEFLLPHFESPHYWIWVRPNPGFTFNNVGVAASITGAARATLLDALMKAEDPIYCDTDSIICRDLPGVPIDKVELGAWDLEDSFKKVVINGKKLYSTWHADPKRRTPEQLSFGLVPEYSVKSKGTARLTWADMLELLDGGEIEMTNRAPTITRYGTQSYIKRTIRATAPILGGHNA